MSCGCFAAFTNTEVTTCYLPNYLSMSAQIHEHSVHSVLYRFVATAWAWLFMESSLINSDKCAWFLYNTGGNSLGIYICIYTIYNDLKETNCWPSFLEVFFPIEQFSGNSCSLHCVTCCQSFQHVLNFYGVFSVCVCACVGVCVHFPYGSVATNQTSYTFVISQLFFMAFMLQTLPCTQHHQKVSTYDYAVCLCVCMYLCVCLPHPHTKVYNANFNF